MIYDNEEIKYTSKILEYLENETPEEELDAVNQEIQFLAAKHLNKPVWAHEVRGHNE